MSKLLKSKFLFGVMLVTVLALAGVVSTASAQTTTVVAPAFNYSGTMRAGMSGPGISTLQAALNTVLSGTIVVDGKFGPATLAAVKQFQMMKGLSADGVVGPMTGNALALATTAVITVPSNLPAGCTSTSGFSTTTGVRCDSGSTLPAGCSSTSGFSPTTGAKCSGGSTPSNNGGLEGGAGTLEFTTSTSNTESTVKEGATEKVLAFKAEADGSDIEVTNVKVILKNNDFAATSEKLTDYVDSVSIWMGDEEVGSADASDFTKDSGSPDTYTKTIALSGAVVREGVKATFFVALTAQDSIDSTDMATADWNVEADTVRYTDSTGIVLSESLGDNVTLTNGFEDGSADDDISIKSSSANPISSSLQVETNLSSDEFLVGAFKLDVDDQSADVDVTSIPVYLEIGVNTDDNGAYATIESIVDEVRVKVGSEWFDADLVDDATANTDFDGATGTATYTVDLDSGELTIDSGDQAEVKVYVTFNEQTSNYIAGTTVVASVVGSAIDAETSNDDVAVTGSFTGKTHTLTVDAPVFTMVGSPTFALYQAIDGVAAGEEDIFLAKFTFDVTAADADVYLSQGVEGDADYAAAADTVQYTKTGGGTVTSAVLDANDTTLDDGLVSSFLVSSGSTERFTLSFYVRGNNDSAKFVIDSFAYGAADDATGDHDDADGDFDYTSVVTSGLSAFQTNSTYLAK